MESGRDDYDVITDEGVVGERILPAGSWYACRKTPGGLIVQIERTGGPLFTTKGAAEQNGLALCREWVDKQKRSNQVQEGHRPDLLH